jgi:hypothetical protein
MPLILNVRPMDGTMSSTITSECTSALNPSRLEKPEMMNWFNESYTTFYQGVSRWGRLCVVFLPDWITEILFAEK